MRLIDLNKKIEDLSLKKFPYTNVVGLSRSIIALGTLLTLLFNPLSNIFHITIDNKIVNPLLNPISPLNNYNFFILVGFENIIFMKWIAICILLITISGYFIKITSILHWWISLSFLYFSSIIDGGDQIAAILTFVLIPLCITDPRKNHWNDIKHFSSSKNIIGLFSIWIIRLQVAIIYFHAAIGKFNVTEWSDGTALYYWFNHSVFGMPIMLSHFINPILSSYVLISFLTYGVILFEILLFLALTSSEKYRKIILPFAVAFHLGIILFHGIFSFFFSISAGLILYLYPTYHYLNFKLWFQKK